MIYIYIYKCIDLNVLIWIYKKIYIYNYKIKKFYILIVI